MYCECWYADSGISEHISDKRSAFDNLKPITPGKCLIKGVGKNNEALQATGIGKISIRSKVDGVWHDCPMFYLYPI
jgi:hypothetical protein